MKKMIFISAALAFPVPGLPVYLGDSDSLAVEFRNVIGDNVSAGIAPQLRLYTPEQTPLEILETEQWSYDEQHSQWNGVIVLPIDAPAIMLARFTRDEWQSDLFHVVRKQTGDKPLTLPEQLKALAARIPAKANEAEALEGVNDVKYMTPLMTQAAIAAFGGGGGPETPTAYTDFNVTMEPLFSGSFVQEGEFTPPTDWEDILIVTQVDIPYMSAGAIAAALQIKTTNGANVIPWAIPVETSGIYNGILDPRVTVVRLQRAGAAVMLNVYMSNSSHQDGQFMNEMNGMYVPPDFDDYGLGNGSGGGYGGYGGGITPIDEMLGMHWQSHTYSRVDGRAISACVFHESSAAPLGDFLLRLHTTQSGSVESLSVRILAR